MSKNLFASMVVISFIVVAHSSVKHFSQVILPTQKTSIARTGTQLVSRQIQIVPTNLSTTISAISTETPIPATTTQKLIYHGITTHSWSSLWGLTGQANAIKSEVDAYETAVGRTVAWVSFADEWQTDGRAFPSDVAISIRTRGAVPVIFLNLRSGDIQSKTDPLYNLSAIIAGQFDSDFVDWRMGRSVLARMSLWIGDGK